MLEVTIYDAAGNEVKTFEDIDYVSFVAPTTYGPPALIAPAKTAPKPIAQVNDRVLYINTGLVPMWAIERVTDR